MTSVAHRATLRAPSSVSAWRTEPMRWRVPMCAEFANRSSRKQSPASWAMSRSSSSNEGVAPAAARPASAPAWRVGAGRARMTAGRVK